MPEHSPKTSPDNSIHRAPPPGGTPHNALMRLGLLLQLQRRVRQAEAAELPFILVNETHILAPYRQAVLWLAAPGGGFRVAAVSGLSVPDPGAPFVQWLESVQKHLNRQPESRAMRPLSAADLPERLGVSWADWLPAQGLWLPLWNRGNLVGVLALFREEPFQSGETELLAHAAEAYAQSFAPYSPGKSPAAGLRRLARKWKFWVPVALCVLLLIPMRQTVLAPAEVIPLRPAHVRAALDGVVEEILVQPNQPVRAGDILLRLDDRQLTTRLVVAQKDLEVARAELQQNQQISLVDPRAKTRLPLLQGRVDQLTAEVELVQSQLERVIVRSPVDGTALVDDPDAWAGRPVSIGQKIMEVADPRAVQLEIALPMADTLPLRTGDKLLFFPNIRPYAPQEASLSFVSYQASETPEAGIAFILRAEFPALEQEINAQNGPGQNDPDQAGEQDTAPRLGLRGTAKLYGDRMPLGALLLRRPILQARQWLGL